MTTHEERKQVIVLLNESITAGARRVKACEVLGLSERTLQRWQTGEAVRCDQRPLRDYQPPHKLTEIERAEVLAVANSDEFGHLPPRARSCHGWPTKAAIWRLSRPFIAYSERENSLPIGVANVRLKHVPNRVLSVLQPLTSSIAGTLLTCPHLSVDSFSISIYSLIFSAGRSSVGRCTTPNAVSGLARCSRTFASAKPSPRSRWCSTLTTAVP